VGERREREVRVRKSVTRKEVFGEEVKEPQPNDCGQSVGTAAWIALREASSPVVEVSEGLEADARLGSRIDES